MHARLLAPWAAFALALPLVSQTPQVLIGNTSAPSLLVRQSLGTCNTQVCPLGLPAPALNFHGGTAYEALRGNVWVSNGPLIQVVKPGTCAIFCPPFPAPGPGPVTGLAVLEKQRRIYMSHQGNVISWHALSCPVSPIGSCPAPVPAGSQIGGLALSDVKDLIFYSASVWAAGVPANNIVFVAPLQNPCTPICSFPVPLCGNNPMGPITGLAFDDCKFVLYATDGKQTVGLFVNVTAAGCNTQMVSCCPNTSGTPLIGLCLEAAHATSSGASCTANPCPACPTMTAGTIGDATLANPAFAITLSGAPSGGTAYLVLNLGACSPPGLPIPPFCGPLLVPLGAPGPIVLGGFPLAGTPPCGGGATVGLPIPPNPALCGFNLAAQWLVLCPAGGLLGTGVTNCITIPISAS
ncbi:MAG: hypothetical protein IT458_16645 [Planctomycetes bacterium]|nr:hypothetical protein [Planctomycetota bacterium]